MWVLFVAFVVSHFANGKDDFAIGKQITQDICLGRGYCPRQEVKKTLTCAYSEAIDTFLFRMETGE